MRVDDAANDFEREAFGGRIHCENLPSFDIVFIATQLDEFAGLELATMEKADRSGEKHDVALLDAAIEERLAWPRRLDHPAVVLEHRLKNPQTLARRDDTFGDHFADDRAVHPRLQRCDRRNGARVLVSVRYVVQQIARGDDAKTPQ